MESECSGNLLKYVNVVLVKSKPEVPELGCIQLSCWPKEFYANPPAPPQIQDVALHKHTTRSHC